MSILFNLFLSYCLLLTPLYSVSAPSLPYEVKQPDGSIVPVRMFGHEYYNWMETEDGYVIDWVDVDNRFGWYYSGLNEEGKFTPTHILVEYPAPDNLYISRKLKESNPYVRNIAHGDSQLDNFHNCNLKRSTENSLIKPLVFLVDFESLPSGMPEKEYSKTQFQHLLFENDLESNGSILPAIYDMSVRDYFYEISNGKLEVYGDDGSIIDWTTVSQNYSYYVDGEQGTGSGTHGIARSAAALVVEIAMEVESELDFSEFDGDGDGAVDVVILIVEGWGDGDNDQFWPHMSLIHGGSSGIGSIDITGEPIPTNDDGYFSLDGVAIKKYIVIPEQFHMNYFGVGKHDIHPIGTICHELGHVLGLPDLYDTSENSAAGIGEWGLMGSGNWQRQTSPSYMSAWSRYQLGFINPIIRDFAATNEEILLPAESNEEEFLAMILPMDSNMPQEYLILENRQKLGADQHLAKSGLLVWHIDETISGMYPAMNYVNVNPDFYGVNLLQADGEGDLYGDSGSSDSKDPFPGSLGVTELDGSSGPNTDTYSYDRDADGTVEQGGSSGISISNIAEDSDGLITFSLTNPNSKGKILGYDEGGYDGVSYHNEYEFLQWAGVRFEVSDTALLSGIETVFPPSFWSWDVTDFTLNVWEGWINNKPQNLLYTNTQNVNWNPDTYRDGGWAHISVLDDTIVWNTGETYYVEINYNGTGGVYPVDVGVYSNSVNDNLSFYRGDTGESCKRLTNHADADWNIRAVMSGIGDFSSLSANFSEIPRKNEIYSNYPNPFNPLTTLSIYLANPSTVNYTVFDLRGRQILQEEISPLGIGRHGFEVNMSQFSSGVYFYQFTINAEKYSPYKMLLLK